MHADIADMADSVSVQAILAHTIETYGRLNVVFNNARVGRDINSAASYDKAMFTRTPGLDLFSMFSMACFSLSGRATAALSSIGG